MISLLAGLSILVVGDSHIAAPAHLMTPLHDALLAKGAQVRTVGVCGSHPGDWVAARPGACGGAERIGRQAAHVHGSAARTRPIGELIREADADVVVIVMGDTMANYDKPAFAKSWAWQQVSSLTRAIAATPAKCVWVGPPWGTEGGMYGKTYARVEMVSRFLAVTTAPCDYIDSLTFTRRGGWSTLDGQHLTDSGYRAWSQAIVGALEKAPALEAARP